MIAPIPLRLSHALASIGTFEIDRLAVGSGALALDVAAQAFPSSDVRNTRNSDLFPTTQTQDLTGFCREVSGLMDIQFLLISDHTASLWG